MLQDCFRLTNYAFNLFCDFKSDFLWLNDILICFLNFYWFIIFFVFFEKWKQKINISLLSVPLSLVTITLG